MLKQKAQEELKEEDDGEKLTKDEIEALVNKQPFEIKSTFDSISNCKQLINSLQDLFYKNQE